MTTVGYGDVHPKSAPGYVVGAFCALSGLLATGLPIPIIANNFTLYYSVSKLKKRLETRDDSVKLSTEIIFGVKNIFRGVQDAAASASSKVISIGAKAKMAITPDKDGGAGSSQSVVHGDSSEPDVDIKKPQKEDKGAKDADNPTVESSV